MVSISKGKRSKRKRVLCCIFCAYLSKLYKHI